MKADEVNGVFTVLTMFNLRPGIWATSLLASLITACIKKVQGSKKGKSKEGMWWK